MPRWGTDDRTNAAHHHADEPAPHDHATLDYAARAMTREPWRGAAAAMAPRRRTVHCVRQPPRETTMRSAAPLTLALVLLAGCHWPPKDIVDSLYPQCQRDKTTCFQSDTVSTEDARPKRVHGITDQTPATGDTTSSSRARASR